MNAMDIRHLQHPKVRDLAWALGTPSLVLDQKNIPMLSSDWWGQEFVKSQDWLMELDKHPEPLLVKLDSHRGRRIGLAFEDLLRCWLDWHPEYTCLAADLPIYEGKRTVGAFDFLIQTDSDILHLEVAVKYYLCVDNSSQWNNWIGPSRRDHLGKKLTKMRDRQLQLLLSPVGKKTLEEKCLPQPTKVAGTIKGIFFQYWGGEDVHPEFCNFVDGIWMFSDDFIETYRDCESHSRFVERIRPNWLAPLQMKEVVDWSEPEILTPIMLSQMTFDVEYRMWVEERRIFVVPNHWSNLERVL
jgi:uncharacterized protein